MGYTTSGLVGGIWPISLAERGSDVDKNAADAED